MNTNYLVEGNNLYFTNARLNTNFTTKTTDDLNQGTTNKYLNALSTANTTESTHTYSTLLPILSPAINTGSIVLSKLNSASYCSNITASTLVQPDASGNFNTNKITGTGGNNASVFLILLCLV